jgi:RNA polymerase sigma-70 factor (ECF subfamily)
MLLLDWEAESGGIVRNCSDRLVEVSAPSSSFVDRLRTGDASALGELTSALYQELHRIASRQLRSERADHTLQATALVHETYMKLSDGRQSDYADQSHFLAVACRVMRQLLVDYARSRSAQKRSAGANQQLITTNLELPSDNGMELIDLIELDSAMDALAAEDERLARLVEMRYFGGMTAEESAEALGISVHVVRHDLRFAQAWLRRKLDG